MTPVQTGVNTTTMTQDIRTITNNGSDPFLNRQVKSSPQALDLCFISGMVSLEYVFAKQAVKFSELYRDWQNSGAALKILTNCLKEEFDTLSPFTHLSCDSYGPYCPVQATHIMKTFFLSFRPVGANLFCQVCNKLAACPTKCHSTTFPLSHLLLCVLLPDASATVLPAPSLLCQVPHRACSCHLCHMCCRLATPALDNRTEPLKKEKCGMKNHFKSCLL